MDTSTSGSPSRAAAAAITSARDEVMTNAVVATWPRKILTLLLLRDQGRVLLGLKKRGFGKGKWNGFGGKLEPNETVPQAAVREMQEESGLTVAGIEERGVLIFEMRGDRNILEVHVFSAASWTGALCESDEMEPRWWAEAEIPFERMWIDDVHWFPLFLRDAFFRGHFIFAGHEDLLSVNLQEFTREMYVAHSFPPASTS